MIRMVTSNAPKPFRPILTTLLIAVAVWFWGGALALAENPQTLEIGEPPAAPDIAPLPPRASRIVPVTRVPLEQTAQSPAVDEQTTTNAPDNDSQLAQLDVGSVVPVNRSTDEELFLEVRLGDLILAEALTGYLNGSSLLLPLRGIFEVLEFPIGVSPAAGTASGWFIRENKLFYMDMRRGTVVVEGREKKFDPAMAEVHADDIYVDIRQLSQWFPVDITFDISNMLVGLTSREPLPIEEKLAREQYRTHVFGARGDAEDTSAYPKVNTPHALLGWPMMSVDTDTRTVKPKGGKIDTITNYNITTALDAGLMNAELFVAGDNRNQVNETRFRLERKDPDGHIIGGLPVTEFSVGDVYSPEMPMVARTQIGRGFTVSTIPLDAPTEFDRITLNGDLPLGWDVEVYRNEVLIGFQSSSSDGRYAFADVPLLFGVNVVKLVFYGPQGQRREEIRQFRVGAGMTKPGEVKFRVSGNQHDARTLYKRRTTTTDLDGESRMFAEAQVGLTRNISAGVNVSAVPTAQGQQRYVGASSATTFGDVYTRGDLVKQQGEGWAARLSGQTAVAGASVIAQHDHYHKFSSEYMPSSTDPLTSRTKLRVDGTIPETAVPRMPFGVTIDHSIHKSKAMNTALTKRLSMAVGRASVTNSLTANIAKSAVGEIDKSVNGAFLLGGRIEDVRVRGQVGYQAAPLKEISSLSMSGDWHISEGYQGRAEVARSFGDTVSTSYSLGANAAFEAMMVGMSLDYNNDQEVVGRVTLNFSLSRDPARGDISMTRGKVASKGAMSSLVYLDQNADGVFGDGDIPLEGVGFVANGVPLKGRTGKDGFAYVSELEPYRDMTLQIDHGTLDDPFWVSSEKGIRVVPRPGTIGEYEFAVVSTGEIDGTAYRNWRDGMGSAAGVIVQLVGDQGDVVREIKTAYDGFFLFDFVPPGDYSLRVSPEQLQTLDLSADQVHAISIKGDGTVVSGQDFILR